MYSIEGMRGETISVDGGTIEKLRGGTTSMMRCPATTYQEVLVKPQSRRKFVLFGEKEEYLQVLVKAAGMMSLNLPTEREHEVTRLREELERAKAAAG